MRRHPPLRRPLIMVMCVLATYFSYTEFYQAAIAEHEILQRELTEKSSRAEAETRYSQEIVATRTILEQRKAAFEKVESRLLGASSAEDLSDLFVSDLATRGLRATRITPIRKEEQNTLPIDGNHWSNERFQIDFRCHYRDLVELLEAWQRLPYLIRFEHVAVGAKEEGWISVELKCVLGRLRHQDTEKTAKEPSQP